MKLKRLIAPGVTVEINVSIGEVLDLLDNVYKEGSLYKELALDGSQDEYAIIETNESLLAVAIQALDLIANKDWEEESLSVAKQYKIVEISNE